MERGGGGGVGITSGHHTLLVLRSKTIVVGDACVGKTAVTQLFYSGGATYPKTYMMTVGADLSVKSSSVPDTDTQVEFHLFDCGGQSIFNQREWGTKYWDGAGLVVVVFDVSNRESFQSCTKWLQRVYEHLGRTIPGVLIANKTDLRESGRGVVEEKEGRALAKSLNLAYFETSAELNTGIDLPFQHLATTFSRQYEDFQSRVSMF